MLPMVDVRFLFEGTDDGHNVIFFITLSFDGGGELFFMRHVSSGP